MHRRQIQSICIVLVFFLAFGAVLWLGAEQGKRNVSVETRGILLNEKTPWDENSVKDPQWNVSLYRETDTVYVTKAGERFHLYADCVSIRNSDSVTGTVCASAIAEGKTLCSYCKNRKQMS